MSRTGAVCDRYACCAQEVADFIMFPVINEACRVVEEVRPGPLPTAKPVCIVTSLCSACYMCSCSLRRGRAEAVCRGLVHCQLS
jgi:hypothetical protein